MQERYDLKYRQIGGDIDDEKELRILNRIIRWGRDVLEYEADQRHAEAIIDAMKVKGMRPVSTPGITEPRKVEVRGAAGTAATCESEKESASFPSGDKGVGTDTDVSSVTTFRSICARLNFLAQDRPLLKNGSD